MAECIKIDEIVNIKSGKVFFDANIWIFIYCEIANSNRYKIKKYSKAFGDLLKSDNSIFIDLAIISEFVNRYLRIAHSNYVITNHLKRKDFDYKRKYRKTEDFKEAWKNVCNIVKGSILPRTETINFDYNRETLGKLLNSETMETDFNDNHIMNLCSTNKMYLLTDDGDFKNSEIKVITANQSYWKNG